MKTKQVETIVEHLAPMRWEPIESAPWGEDVFLKIPTLDGNFVAAFGRRDKGCQESWVEDFRAIGAEYRQNWRDDCIICGATMWAKVPRWLFDEK